MQDHDGAAQIRSEMSYVWQMLDLAGWWKTKSVKHACRSHASTRGPLFRAATADNHRVQHKSWDTLRRAWLSPERLDPSPKLFPTTRDELWEGNSLWSLESSVRRLDWQFLGAGDRRATYRDSDAPG